MFCSFPALQPPSVTTFTAKVTQAQGTWASPALAVRPHLALREDLLGSLRVCDTSRITQPWFIFRCPVMGTYEIHSVCLPLNFFVTDHLPCPWEQCAQCVPNRGGVHSHWASAPRRPVAFLPHLVWGAFCEVTIYLKTRVWCCCLLSSVTFGGI